MQTLPPPSSLTQPKPGIHMDLTPSITATVPGLGSVEVGADFDTVRGAGSAGGAESVFSSALISVFDGSLSTTASTSGSEISAERVICGVFL